MSKILLLDNRPSPAIETRIKLEVPTKLLGGLTFRTPLCKTLCGSVPLAAGPPNFCRNHRPWQADGKNGL